MRAYRIFAATADLPVNATQERFGPKADRGSGAKHVASLAALVQPKKAGARARFIGGTQENHLQAADELLRCLQAVRHKIKELESAVLSRPLEQSAECRYPRQSPRARALVRLGRREFRGEASGAGRPCQTRPLLGKATCGSARVLHRERRHIHETGVAKIDERKAVKDQLVK